MLRLPAVHESTFRIDQSVGLISRATNFRNGLCAIQFWAFSCNDFLEIESCRGLRDQQY
jgi:hypothetical protein